MESLHGETETVMCEREIPRISPGLDGRLTVQRNLPVHRPVSDGVQNMRAALHSDHLPVLENAHPDNRTTYTNDVLGPESNETTNAVNAGAPCLEIEVSAPKTLDALKLSRLPGGFFNVEVEA